VSASKGGLLRIAQQAQDFVFELLSHKVEDLLDSLATVKFDPSYPPSNAHSVTEEIVDFLEVTFMGLMNLPQAAREAAYFTCCTQISHGFIDEMMSPHVLSINMYGIAAILFDVRRLERFADSCKVSQLKQCFAELRAIVELLMNPDLPKIAESPELLRRMQRIDFSKLSAITDKMVPAMSRSDSLPSYDKKTLQLIAKRFRAFAAKG
jgi:hypothetical protein